jgi:hypothetical protein
MQGMEMKDMKESVQLLWDLQKFTLNFSDLRNLLSPKLLSTQISIMFKLLFFGSKNHQFVSTMLYM